MLKSYEIIMLHENPTVRLEQCLNVSVQTEIMHKYRQ